MCFMVVILRPITSLFVFWHRIAIRLQPRGAQEANMAFDIVNVIAEFSPCGDYLACSDSSGALQIWETSTGIKRQQYVPSSHLSATCSCIAWAPKRSATRSVSSDIFLTIFLAKDTTLHVVVIHQYSPHDTCQKT